MSMNHSEEASLSLSGIAYLTSEFGPKYEESILMAGYYKYQRKRGDTGNDVMRALTADARRRHPGGTR